MLFMRVVLWMENREGMGTYEEEPVGEETWVLGEQGTEAGEKSRHFDWMVVCFNH